MTTLTPRILFALTALGCGALLGFGYYLQYFDGLEPCPMCIFQRLCYMGIGGVGVIGAIHGPRRAGVLVYGIATVVFAAIGGAIAGRQVWLQHLPADQVPECGPGLEFMLEMYPLADVIRTALAGTGECAEVAWTFLGLSIAGWSLVCFSAIFVVYIAYMTARMRHTRTLNAL